MKKIIYAMMFCVSSAVFAQPNDGEWYYIKAYNDQYVGIKADVLVLGDESQRTAFLFEKSEEHFYLRSYEARYISAEEKGENELSAKVSVQRNKQSFEAFSFQELKPNTYTIKSLKLNTYLRANTDIGQIDQAEHAKRWETFELVVVPQGDHMNATARARDSYRQSAEFLDSHKTHKDHMDAASQARDAYRQSNEFLDSHKARYNGHEITFNPDRGGVTLSKEANAIKLLDGYKVVGSARDPQNNFWFATEKDGIFVFDHLLNQQCRFGDEKWGKGWTANIYITAMHQDPSSHHGDIWIGLDAGKFMGLGGLVRFTPSADGDLNKGTWNFFTKDNSRLPSNHVKGFLSSNDRSTTSVILMKDGKVEMQMPLSNLNNN